MTTLLQCGPSICGGSSQTSRPLQFAYDLGGTLTSESDPSSGQIAYGRSIAGEITSVTNQTFTDAGNTPNLISNVVLGAFGPTSYSLGNGLQTVQTWDNFGRKTGTYLCNGSSSPDCSGGTSQLYGNYVVFNGSQAVKNCDTILSVCENTSYDEFGRLKGVSSSGGSGSYTYDRSGNRTQQVSQQGGPSPSYSFDSSNHIIGLSYDAAGNAMNDGVQHSFTYDAEGNVVSVDAGNTAIYVYDAYNHRVGVQASGTSY